MPIEGLCLNQMNFILVFPFILFFLIGQHKDNSRHITNELGTSIRHFDIEAEIPLYQYFLKIAKAGHHKTLV